MRKGESDVDQIIEHWGDPDGHMREYWSVEHPVIKLENVPKEYGATSMGPGFQLQKVVYTKTFMWDFDSMKPRLGTPIHSHYQDEAWFVVSGEGLFRAAEKVHRIKAGDYVFLPGGVRHQIMNTSPTEPLVYQVVLAPPVTPDSIIVYEPFSEAHLKI